VSKFASPYADQAKIIQNILCNGLMNKLLISFLIIILSLQLSKGQTVYDFDGLRFKLKLPYQQPFVIQGDRQFLKGKAVAGKLQITGSGYSHEFYWWSTDPSKTKYSFYIDHELQYGQPYQLKFTFYQETQYSDEIKAVIEKRVHQALLGFRNRRGTVSADDVKVAVNTIVTTDLSAKQFFDLTFVNGVITETPITPATANQNKDWADVANYINDEVQLEVYNGDMATKINNINTFSSTNWSNLQTFLTTFKINRSNVFSRVDVDAVRSFLDNKDDLPATTENKITTARASGLLSSNQQNMLSDLYNHLLDVRRIKGQIKEARKRIDTNTQNFKSTFNDLVTNIYGTLGSDVVVNEVPSTNYNATDVDKTRFSVIVGAGVSAIGPNLSLSKVSYNPYTFVAFKYYLFSRVDKTVEQPYLKGDNWQNKLSLIAGWRIGGDWVYQGQSMSDVLGLRPVVGVGYDFKKIFTVGATVSFFSQPNKSPFKNDNNFNWAPSIFVSLDLDLINRLSSLLKNTPYDTTPK
jgi:hypothetical protein